MSKMKCIVGKLHLVFVFIMSGIFFISNAGAADIHPFDGKLHPTENAGYSIHVSGDGQALDLFYNGIRKVTSL